MKLWHIVEGPFVLEDDRGYILGKVQMLDDDPEITHEEFFFDDFNSAYKVAKYFHSNISPLSAEDIGRLIKVEDDNMIKEFPN